MSATVESISKMLQKGLEDLFCSQKYAAFLKMIAKFPNYSYRNIILLLRQCPHATQVMGFKSWLRHGRSVRSGEKALRIIAPFAKDEHKNKNKDKDDDVDTFRRISVFDYSQTERLDGQEETMVLPDPVQLAVHPFGVEVLEGDVAGFDNLMTDLKVISPYPIRIEPLSDNRKGYCNYTQRYIVVKQGLSQLQTVKTTIHEVAHSMLHYGVTDKQQREMEAESIAFVVCQYLGLDTSSYSFGYIAGYSIGKEKKEIKDFLDTIQKTASFIIDSIEGARETRRIAYDNGELALLVNSKTIMRIFSQGLPVYLVFPGQGEQYAMKKEEIFKHPGPFAVDSAAWRGSYKTAA